MDGSRYETTQGKAVVQIFFFYVYIHGYQSKSDVSILTVDIRFETLLFYSDGAGMVSSTARGTSANAAVCGSTLQRRFGHDSTLILLSVSDHIEIST